MTDKAKTRIIEAAGPIFAHKGFSGTTVREICNAAKVNQAAINYYFGSKESLYKEVFASTYSSFTPWSEPFTEPAIDTSIPFETRLMEIIVRRTREIFATKLSGWKIQLLFREIHDPSPCCGEKLQEFICRDYQLLYRYLDEFFDPETPTDVRWKCVFSLIGAILHYKNSRWLLVKMFDEQTREMYYKPEQIATFVVDAFFAAAAPYRRKR